jgi:hypothetical protein
VRVRESERNRAYLNAVPTLPLRDLPLESFVETVGAFRAEFEPLLLRVPPAMLLPVTLNVE